MRILGTNPSSVTKSHEQAPILTKQPPLNNKATTQREKEHDQTQCYDESPYTNRKLNDQLTTQKRHQNDRLLTEARRWHEWNIIW